MDNILHIFKTEPDAMVADLIQALTEDEGIAVVCLYPDAISFAPINWSRLVDDIFRYDWVICW